MEADNANTDLSALRELATLFSGQIVGYIVLHHSSYTIYNYLVTAALEHLINLHLHYILAFVPVSTQDS